MFGAKGMQDCARAYVYVYVPCPRERVARALNARTESACSFSICLFGIYLFVPLVGWGVVETFNCAVIEWRVPDFPQSRCCMQQFQNVCVCM